MAPNTIMENIEATIYNSANNTTALSEVPHTSSGDSNNQSFKLRGVEVAASEASAAAENLGSKIFESQTSASSPMMLVI
jgi:hypothetical protein